MSDNKTNKSFLADYFAGNYHMYKSSKIFLVWILIFAVGFNLIPYLFNVLFRVGDWIFTDLEVAESPSRYIFFGYSKPARFLETTLQGFIIVLVIGIVWWAVEKFYFKRFD